MGNDDGANVLGAVIVQQQSQSVNSKHEYLTNLSSIGEGVHTQPTHLPTSPNSAVHNHAQAGLNCANDCQILLNPTTNIVPSQTTMSATAINSPTSHQTQVAIASFLSQHPVLKAFIAGSLSGTCSSLLFQPFDLIKTRIQNANFAMSGNNSTGMVAASTESVPNRIIPILFNVVKNEQLIGLWRGTLPSLMRCVPGVGLHFCCLDTLQNHFCPDRKPTATEAFIFGSASRSVAGVLLIPVTVIKTRYESGVFVYKSITDAVRHTYKNEGIRGLTSGLMPTLARDVPFSGLYYMFYSQLKSAASSVLVDETQPQKRASILTSSFVTFFCGMNAGLLASIVTQPMDVVKTHMQLYPKRFPSSFQTVILILKNKGPHGLFAGLVPRMMRRTLVASMTWTVFEQMMKNLGLK